MKREREEEMKSGRGAPSIFFFELSEMSTTMGLLYILGIIGFFAVIFWVLINKIVAKPVDFTTQRKQKIAERASKKSSGKKNL